MKKIILIFVFLIFINSVPAYNFEETIYGLESEEPITITFDNNTGSVNSSSFWDDLDTPEDIAYSDLYTNFWDTNVNLEGFNITDIDYLNVSGRMRLFMPFGYAYGFRVTGDDDEHAYAGMLSTGEVGVFVAGSETGASVDLSLMNSLTGAEVERLRIDGVTGLFDFKGNDATNINNLDVTYNITADSFSNLESGTAEGQMAFWNGTKWVKTETSELFWDDTNKRLGIGTATLYDAMEIYRSLGDTTLKIHSDTGGTDKAQIYFRCGGNDYKIYTTKDPSGFYIDAENLEKAFTIKNYGNIGIGTTTPDTKLQVVGDFSLQNDSDKIFLGASQDVSMNFNSTDFVETAEVGSFNRFWNGFTKFFFSGNIDVDGNVTADNVHLPSYVSTHTNTSITAVEGVWLNVTFDVHNDAENARVTHTYNDATNDTFTIVDTGVYRVSYGISFLDSQASPDNIVAIRLIKDSTEIEGSVFEKDTTKQNALGTIYRNVMVSLTTGDELKLQFISNSTSVSMQTAGTYGSHPTSANLNIHRIS